uniref:Putative glycosyltransferase n=1 Tax=viral metagenome TaxID=1070528 RepID=A0A6M3J268_9ZZZZ
MNNFDLLSAKYTHPNLAREMLPIIASQNTFQMDYTNKNLLFIYTGGFGDLCMLTPLAKYLKRTYKGVRIEVATVDMWVESFKGHPYFDAVYPFTPENVLPARRFIHRVVDFNMALAKSRWANIMHGVDVHFKWFDPQFDLSILTPEDKLPILSIQRISKEKAEAFWTFNDLNDKIVVGIQLHTSGFVRMWLKEYYDEVIANLTNKGIHVIFLEETSPWYFTGDRIHWNTPYCRTMQDNVALASKCDVILAPDSAFAHIAQAFDIPSVVLFGANPPAFRTGYHPKSYPMWSHPVCAPCFNLSTHCPKAVPSPCMVDLKPDIVLNAIMNQIYTYVKDLRTTILRKEPVIECPFCYSIDVDNKLLGSNSFYNCKNCQSLFVMGTEATGIHSCFDNPDYLKHLTEEEYIKYKTEYTQRIIEDIKTRFVGFGQLHIADIGSELGTISNTFRKASPNLLVDSFDINCELAYEAKERYNVITTTVDVVSGMILNPNQYEVVILDGFIEHLPKTQLKDLLLRCCVALQPKFGTLYLRTPVAEEFYSNDGYDPIVTYEDYNVSIGTLKGFEALCNKIGLQIVSHQIINAEHELTIQRQGSVKQITQSFPMAKKEEKGRPVVSISVLACNRLEQTKKCIVAISERLTDIPFEVIITDNGSTDGTKEYLTTLNALKELGATTNMKFIYHSNNLGFSRGHRKALEQASGEFFLMLNNDMYIQEDYWLEKFIGGFKGDPLVRAVAVYPSRLRPDGTGFRVTYGEPFEYLEGSCFAVPVEFIKTFGLFDINFKGSYCEDSDLCLRLREAKFKLKAIELNTIHDNVILTTQTLPSGHNAVLIPSLEYFLNKWSTYMQTRKFEHEKY